MITPQILLKAYAAGIFPMAENANDNMLYWIEPDQRGILPLDGFHLSRSLAKRIRQQVFDVHIDRDFNGVIDGCAEPAPGRNTTWINERIRTLYGQLFKMGCCHTVECWQGDELVGGLYGVRIGGAFFGESMFSRQSDASKIALVHLVARLRYGGFTLLDTQFITNHLSRFGAIELEKSDYLDTLAHALTIEADFHQLSTAHAPQQILDIVTVS